MRKYVFQKALSFVLKVILSLYFLFPVGYSLYAQIQHIIKTWDAGQFLLFEALVIISLAPAIFIVFLKDHSFSSPDKLRPYLIVWILAVALVFRVLLAQLISTDFTSDFADVHAAALDIFAGYPLKNLGEYPNIPNSLHLNMPAIILAQMYNFFGPGPRVAKIFIIVLDTLTTFFIYQTGKMIDREKTGILAALLYALLPSISIYTGTLAGEYLAFPFMLLAIIIYIYLHNSEKSYLHNFLGFVLLGIATGILDWFRPLGMVLLIAFIIANLLKTNTPQHFLKMTSLSLILFIAYSLTTQLAVNISEHVFKTNIRGTSQRIGEYFIKGLNPTSGGRVTLEDHNIVYKTYNQFGEDSAGAQRYLIQLALSRLDSETFINLAKEKFLLIWSTHDSLFDYALIGSNDREFVELLRNFETLLWPMITFFIMYNAYTSFRKKINPGLFAMQLFILGFAILFIFMEVQNRYIAIVIPYSVLLSIIGANQFFSDITPKSL